MEPIEVLCDEHRAIWRGLACLEVAAHRLQRGQPVRPGLFIDVADFVEGFADELHHRKEEEAFFPAMNAAGVPAPGGPAHAFLGKHDDARRFPAAMRRAAQRLASGDEHVADELVTSVEAYIGRLRQHMFKEDMLFLMARRHLDTQQQAALAAAFACIEREAGGTREKYLDILASVEQELEGASREPCIGAAPHTSSGGLLDCVRREAASTPL